MRRTSGRVQLLERDSFSMTNSWTDRIEVRRSPSATFSVWADKFGDCPDQSRRDWYNIEKAKGLRNPLDVYAAVENMAEVLNVTIEWCDAVSLMASLDWLTAAVIARHLEVDLPPLPDVSVLLAQRSLSVMSKITLGVEWVDEIHELSLSFEKWIRILQGESNTFKKIYWYEGARFAGIWNFDGKGNLDIACGEDGMVWEGRLQDMNYILGPVVDGEALAVLALDALVI